MRSRLKLFIHFDEQGQVLSVAKVIAAGGAAPNPFMHVEQQELVLEMDATEEFEALHAHEIAEQYTVDVKSRKLRKQKPGRAEPPASEQKSPGKKPRRKSDRK